MLSSLAKCELSVFVFELVVQPAARLLDLLLDLRQLSGIGELFLLSYLLELGVSPETFKLSASLSVADLTGRRSQFGAPPGELVFLGTLISEQDIARHLRVICDCVTFLRTVVKPATQFSTTRSGATSIWTGFIKVRWLL